MHYKILNRIDVLVILFENDLDGRSFAEETVGAFSMNIPKILIQVKNEQGLRQSSVQDMQ